MSCHQIHREWRCDLSAIPYGYDSTHGNDASPLRLWSPEAAHHMWPRSVEALALHAHGEPLLRAAPEGAARGRHVAVVAADGDLHVRRAGEHVVGRVEAAPAVRRRER